MPLSRRRFLTSGSAIGAALPFATASVYAQSGLVPDPSIEQTLVLQSAIDAAASSDGRLSLPSGRFVTRTLHLPSNVVISGVPGATTLIHAGQGALFDIRQVRHVTLSGLTLDGSGADGDEWHGGLIHVSQSSDIVIEACNITNTQLNGLSALSSSVRITNCDVWESALSGIFIYDGEAVFISNNRVHDCGNGGIRVWRGENAIDGAIVTGNRIWNIDWTNGGNGQNGNGINVFRADGVIVSDNAISDCTFSAIRLNTTNNTQIVGNTCFNSGEVAIFSEFEFSGSVIANNIVDGAAAGISMTNYNDNGRLASCTGNIVRNIATHSEVNPDTSPYGIAAEADAIVTGNLVDNVPGVGILAGWGPYLRDVTISSNLVRDVHIGITVSVADGAGSAVITGNVISGARDHAITANRWWDIASRDPASDGGQFSNLTIRDNTIIGG
ncbi:TIGR03808 family TAT-translocated repetitive protein [Pelagibacterium lentulum]|uniref:Tat protein n=1 Tax=Pelagibacterium lentulum TaxID=2029865 RepID=A0A916RHY8_9HYPH|nr:TIGR03808 family TAT-translocated repetitive protein [Pelagibacterium lentulum]GGA54920.1 Tat protein [Pelagibacterium lentulum]